MRVEPVEVDAVDRRRLVRQQVRHVLQVGVGLRRRRGGGAGRPAVGSLGGTADGRVRRRSRRRRLGGGRAVRAIVDRLVVAAHEEHPRHDEQDDGKRPDARAGVDECLVTLLRGLLALLGRVAVRVGRLGDDELKLALRALGLLTDQGAGADRDARLTGRAINAVSDVRHELPQATASTIADHTFLLRQGIVTTARAGRQSQFRDAPATPPRADGTTDGTTETRPGPRAGKVSGGGPTHREKFAGGCPCFFARHRGTAIS